VTPLFGAWICQDRGSFVSPSGHWLGYEFVSEDYVRELVRQCRGQEIGPSSKKIYSAAENFSARCFYQ
jgi:hypothetical protein